MKKHASVLIALLFGATLIAQQNTKRVFLSPKSTITTSEVAEGFAKYCPNVTLTENKAKADYVLEAAETVSADDGSTSRHWHFTLFNLDGDVLVTTHPETHLTHRFKHHFETVCKFVTSNPTPELESRDERKSKLHLHLLVQAT